MRSFSLVTRILVVLVVAFLAGCVSKLQVQGDWEEGAVRNETFKRVLVVGLSPRYNGRCEFEHFMRTQIRSAATMAQTSCNLSENTELPTIDDIKRMVKEYKADAVLVTVLVNSAVGAEAGGQRDTRGGLDFKVTGAGFGGMYNGGFGAYGMPVIYGEFKEAPVITSVQGEVTIATKLFATSNAALIYQIQTTAKDLGSTENALAAITPPIADRLRKEGLIQ